MRNTYNGYKPTLKDYIKTASLIFIFVLFCIAAIALLGGKPKEVKTAEQMSAVFSKYGFESADLTQDAREKYPDSSVNKVVYYRKDDEVFEYYIFDDTEHARSAYAGVCSKMEEIERNKRVNQKEAIATDGYRANISFASLVTDESFYYLCRIDNSVLYVTCNPDSKNDAYKIINELNYNMDRKESE